MTKYQDGWLLVYRGCLTPEDVTNAQNFIEGVNYRGCGVVTLRSSRRKVGRPKRGSRFLSRHRRPCQEFRDPWDTYSNCTPFFLRKSDKRVSASLVSTVCLKNRGRFGDR